MTHVPLKGDVIYSNITTTATATTSFCRVLPEPRLSSCLSLIAASYNRDNIIAYSSTVINDGSARTYNSIGTFHK